MEVFIQLHPVVRVAVEPLLQHYAVQDFVLVNQDFVDLCLVCAFAQLLSQVFDVPDADGAVIVFVDRIRVNLRLNVRIDLLLFHGGVDLRELLPEALHVHGYLLDLLLENVLEDREFLRVPEIFTLEVLIQAFFILNLAAQFLVHRQDVLDQHKRNDRVQFIVIQIQELVEHSHLV